MITNDCNGHMARVCFLGVDLLGQTEYILKMLLICISKFPLEDYISTNTHFPLFLWHYTFNFCQWHGWGDVSVVGVQQKAVHHEGPGRRGAGVPPCAALS